MGYSVDKFVVIHLTLNLFCYFWIIYIDGSPSISTPCPIPYLIRQSLYFYILTGLRLISHKL